MRSMRSAGSGPCSPAPAFSRTWATVRNPGSGSVAGLRPQIQASAPWTSVRPPAVSSSRAPADVHGPPIPAAEAQGADLHSRPGAEVALEHHQLGS
jgi:hypothetical protein